MNSKKPTLISPMTASTRATIACGRWRENSVTITVHSARMKVHNRIEPSCPPHTAAKR